jgi:hypothetical protein
MNARIALVGIALAAVVGWWVWPVASVPPGSVENATQEESVEPIAAAKAAAHATDATREQDSGVGTRQLVAEMMSIVGRCVTPDGKAVASVPLRLSLRRRELDEACWAFPGEAHVPEPLSWRAPEAIQSADDGTFAFRLPPTKFELRLDADGPFAVDHKCSRLFTELSEGPVHDVGDIIVHLGFPVRGTVVDQFGRPVSGTLLAVGHHEGAPTEQVIDGLVDFGCVAPTDYGMDCALGLVTPKSIQVGPGHDTSDLRFVVQCMPVLSCLVVDDITGKPVPGKRLEPSLRDAEIGHGRPWTLSANEAGRFWIRGNLPANNTVRA